jgi:putative restriction endonuclease
MAVRLAVAVTDFDWFEFLRRIPNLTEANFWAPSGSPFKALQPGEFFLFKLHSPRNFIVGGGLFTYANTLPCSLAWQAFGPGNGAASLSEMRKRIARYRRADLSDRSDFPVGCRILANPFFFEERNWLPVPETWSQNIVSFKTYSTDEADGRKLWDAIQERIVATPDVPGFAEHIARYGEPVLIRPRLGQGAFRILVTDVYRRRCAVTSERTLPALDAAHIRPFADGGNHEASNGLLLRRDLHSLFDAGYVTITPDYKFEVSRRIREEYENGRQYYALSGTPVFVPERTDCRPDSNALAWHNECRYFG